MKTTPLTLFLLFLCNLGFGQIGINEYVLRGNEIIPTDYFNCLVFSNYNTPTDVNLVVVAEAGNEMVFRYESGSVRLTPGLNIIRGSGLSIINKQYGTGNKGVLLRQTGRMPAGNLDVCMNVISRNIEIIGNELCTSMEVLTSSILDLVYPLDGDTVYSLNPDLSWFHDQLFNPLQKSPYRMVVVEAGNQGGNLLINEFNSKVIWIGDGLSSHLCKVPFGISPGIEYGKTYLWKVQELSNNRVIAETETWVFHVFKPSVEQPVKYVELNRETGSKLYKAYGGLVYFKFDDRYKSKGKLNWKLYNSKRKLIETDLKTEAYTASSAQVIKHDHDNRFILDLTFLNLRDGVYLLEIMDETGNKFELNIEL